LYDKALEIDPINVYALNNKGVALGSLDRSDEAIPWFDKALEIDPIYVDALNNKGVALHYLGKYKEAITWYDKALEIDPIYVDALNNKGVALGSLGRSDEAITWFDKALEIDPIYVSALYNKGLALHYLGKYQEAIAWYDKALEIDPIDIDILNNKAVAVSKSIPGFPDTNQKSPGSIIRVQTGDTSTPYDEAIKIDPNNVQLLTNAGIYLAEKKQMYHQALLFFDKVLKKDDNYVQAMYNKAETLDKLGRSDEAQILFDSAIKLDPTYNGDYIKSSYESSKASAVSAASVSPIEATL
jgi:tetratricopeptide (TPR) repeat protein